MKNLLHAIGSPSSLVYFEVAARHLSFTKAADELNVSQPAISRKMRELEEMLGCRLFSRQHNLISLTTPGEQLYAVVQPALRDITAVVNELGQAWKSTTLTVRSHMALLTHFVIPALDDLSRDFEIEVVSARNDAPLDLRRAGLAILYGDGNWPGFASEPLLSDSYFPVCAPALVERHGTEDLSELVRRDTLLVLSNHVDPNITWAAWQGILGDVQLSQTSQRSFNDYEVLLQACRRGKGIAIGSACIVAPLLKSGLLQRIGEDVRETQFGYHVVCDSLLVESPRLRRLINFLKDAAARYEQEVRAAI